VFKPTDNLHEQAKHLYGQRGRSLLAREGPGVPSHVRDATDRATFLLGAFALENAIKAFLVFENPAWISNGRLARQLRSHQLVQLQSQSTLIPFRRRYIWVLRSVEAGIESWARNLCGLTAEARSTPAALLAFVWDGYLRLMRAYAIRLMDLLRGGWKRPHGFNGRWTFTGSYLCSAH
jgi:hypothetical protein